MPFQYNVQNPELLRGLQNAEMQQNAPIYLQETVNQPAQYINQAITPPAEINQQYTGEKYQLFKDNFPYASNNLTPRDFNMQNQIYEQKLNYDNAQKALAKATTDEEKTAYQNIMEDAATNAKLLRDNAQKLGLNTTGFGADNSFGEAVQTLNYNRNRGMMNLLDMPSTSAQMRDVYKGARQMGYSPSEARDIAGRFHDEFRETNTQRLVEGIGAYGTNSDGSLNEFGQRLLGKLAYESPYHYQTIANGFANPKDIFNVNANMAQTALNNQSAWDRAVLSADTSKEIAANNLEERRNEFNLSYQFDIAKFNSDLEYKNAVLKANERDRLSQTPAGQLQAWKDFGKMCGMSDEEISKFAPAMVLAQQNKGGSRSSGENDKVSQSREEIQGIFAGQFIRLQNAIESGNMQKAEEILTGIDTLAGDTTFKNIGLLTPDDMNYISKSQTIYNQVIKGKMTLEQAKEMLGTDKTSNYKGGNDQKMAEYQNNPDKLNTEIDSAIAASEEKKKAAEQHQQNAEKSAQIYNDWTNNGVYQNSNAPYYQMPVLDANGNYIGRGGIGTLQQNYNRPFLGRW